jgi:nicotinamide phosphoribosyltransferase
MSTDIVGRSDLYKYTHHDLYPKGIRKVHSFMESRGGKFSTVIPFSQQYYLMEYLEGVRVTKRSIEKNKARIDACIRPGLFNEKGWMHILEKHGGKLPLIIKSIPEGTKIDAGIPFMTIENTDEEVPWLTNFVETLLMKVWYGTTVASQQHAKRLMMLNFLEKTGTPEAIDFKWHDFGDRGSTSEESASVGGAAHLMNFLGTDTTQALEFIEEYYSGPLASGFSIPASEHSVITSWGRDHERDAYENFLKTFPDGIAACVSDSYDFENACQVIWGSELKDQVLARDGVLVVRPDSGDPESVVIRGLELLGEAFGYEDNEKGYKVLNPKVRIIQGDGINYESAYQLLSAVVRKGWSIDNLALGEGSGALQLVNRDTCKMAIKCSAILDVEGIWQDVYKDPKTDPGKVSKKGRQSVVFYNDQFRPVRTDMLFRDDCLEPIFKNGEILKYTTWDEILQRVRS